MTQPALWMETEHGFTARTESAPGELAKDAGIAQAAANKESLLKFARKVAVELANKRGAITADDVQQALVARGISVHALGNAAGALFRNGDWEPTGRRVKSKRTHAHQNLLTEWRLKRQ